MVVVVVVVVVVGFQFNLIDKFYFHIILIQDAFEVPGRLVLPPVAVFLDVHALNQSVHGKSAMTRG